MLARSKNERRRNFIGDQVEECKDLSGLYYLLPFQKGYLVNWDIQRQVWEYAFNDLLKLDPSTTSLVFTEPPFNFPSIQDTLNEIFFEDFKFSSVLITNSSTLSTLYQYSINPAFPCCLVIDSGYSFTHIVPHCRGRVVVNGIKRIDVGGKLLTNHLKEIVSYRQLHVMDETFVMNQVKEEVCYVSQDLYKDFQVAALKGSENIIRKEYVLPDFTTVKKGYVKGFGAQKTNQDEQSIKLSNERFTVPEILFHPSDISIQQMGIAEAIVASVQATPTQMQPHLYNNILLTGGNANFPGFKERVYQELRKLVPDFLEVNITLPAKPVCTPWFGGKWKAEGNSMEKGPPLESVSLAEYREHGHAVCNRKFREEQIWMKKD